jgi:hypothetical protein
LFIKLRIILSAKIYLFYKYIVKILRTANAFIVLLQNFVVSFFQYYICVFRSISFALTEKTRQNFQVRK